MTLRSSRKPVLQTTWQASSSFFPDQCITDGASPVFFCTKSLVISLVNSGWARLCLNHFEPGPISCEVKTAHKPGKNHGERTFRVQSFKVTGATYNRLPSQNTDILSLVNQITPGKPGHFEFNKNLDLHAPIRYKQFRLIYCLHSWSKKHARKYAGDFYWKLYSPLSQCPYNFFFAP